MTTQRVNTPNERGTGGWGGDMKLQGERGRQTRRKHRIRQRKGIFNNLYLDYLKHLKNAISVKKKKKKDILKPNFDVQGKNFPQSRLRSVSLLYQSLDIRLCSQSLKWLCISTVNFKNAPGSG